jgi:ABC-type spermidine/putrescine transport system permease subunit I
VPRSPKKRRHQRAVGQVRKTRPLRESIRILFLLTPPLAVFSLLLIFPLATVLDQSFKIYEAGRVGASETAPRTLHNYVELLEPAYFFYFIETFRLAFTGTVISVVLAFPIAYLIARMRSTFWRGLAWGALIAIISVSTLVRVYALLLTLGPVGYGRQLSAFFGLSLNGATYTELMVLAGLVYFHTPVSALILVGTIQSINPRLVEAAQSLGAPRWKSHLSITLPLSLHGITAAFLISFTVCASAFVIPLILGKGKVLFVSNLIYSRFSVVSNYPSGSAISIILLAVAIVPLMVLPWLLSYLSPQRASR